LRQARVGQVRVPHKPLLLLWLFGQFATTGSSAASYQQAEEPVSQLINDFGPPVASAALARQRAAMPFVHLERELWDLRDATGNEIAPDVPERRALLCSNCHRMIHRKPPWPTPAQLRAIILRSDL
jgi:putative restriction endonuclease